MKKTLIISAITMAILSASCSNNNPLLQDFNAPHGAVPFDKIKTEHYMPAFKYSIEQARKELDAITNSKEEPTFANTIEALDYSGLLLGRTSGIFFNVNEAETNDEMQKIAQEVLPMLTDFYNDISLNEKLFERVKKVYETIDKSKLTPEQNMLLDKVYKSFTRKGANLCTEDKAKYRELSKELSLLTLKFKNNVLAETNAYTLNITDSVDLKGLPASVIEQAALAAKDKGMEGWLFTLHAPSLNPFLKYADNRELRKKLYIAANTKGAQGNEYDNREVIRKITDTRLQMANLLGYKTYADYVLEERMAENTSNVNKLLNQLLTAGKPFASGDVNEVHTYAKRNGFKDKIQPYDWSYYAEKLQEEKYKLNEELLRPYFKVDNVISGVFSLVKKLYGIELKENKEIPVYHSDVRVYEVFDKNGDFIALYYLDLYPREGKRGGAWMNDIKEQYKRGDYIQRPHVINVCNFTKPTASKPALLSFYEVTTLLHEFGHALHSIFSDVTYPSLSGTNVYRDFVELPSQIMENWAVEKEFLDMFAVHNETGEKIPAELVKKIVASQNYLAGYLTLRQLTFGLLDMSYHSLDKPLVGDIDVFEAVAIAPSQTLPRVEGCLISTAFNHIFSGGYAAGYYSYKWAEVLEADAFSLFQKNGIFDTKTAGSFRENILSKGGSEHPMVLYKRFRGQDPTVNALLKKEGFIK
ncbi:MAG: M3 family metallopeptidase [Prevotellaceae bacterium]|jgi:peptidyl-dipeptidase Dcp|nr:M3 family metallopeptidase [Prevotellaceae bacterium]